MLNIKISDKLSFPKLLLFAIPSIVMFLFLGSYGIADALFVANCVDSNALSALNITYPITSLFYAIGVMFACGGSALVSKLLGEGKDQEAKKCFTLINVTALTIGLILSIISIIFLEPILNLIGADNDTLGYSKEYLIILLAFMPFCILQVLYQSFFIVISKPTTGLVFTISSGLTNILLDYIFIVLCNFGIKGAAFGTVCGQAVTAIGGLIIFFNKKNTLHYCKFNFNFNYITKSILNGSSEMIINLATSIITLVFNLSLYKLAGNKGVAAITAILYFQFFMQALIIGYSSGVAPIFSYNYGEKQVDYIKIIRNKSLIFVSVSGLFITLLSLGLSSSLASLFSNNDKEIYDLIYRGNMIFSINYAFAAVSIFLSSFFTALNDGITSAIIAFCRTFLFIIIFTPIFTEYIGIDGVWLVIPLSEFLTFIIAISLFPFSYKKDITKVLKIEPLED